jgi:2-iminobutanoate/2-iminopropanoate deaminase
MMALERIQPQGLAKPGTYSHVIRAGNTVYISGQTATDAQGNVVGRGDITAQSVQVFENLKAALASVGGTFADVASITVYITDARYRDPMREVRTRYLGDKLPTSTLLVVAGLADPEYLLEISAIAVVG